MDIKFKNMLLCKIVMTIAVPICHNTFTVLAMVYHDSPRFELNGK